MFSHVTQRSVTLAARIQPPETFDFSTPNEWPKWRKRFERYLVVSGMKKKEEADKIDLFMYLMGDRADDIFRTFKFEKEEEATKIDSVLKAFDSHFCVRKNIIYERAKFNSRIQEDREPVDEFITSLYKLADSCEFEGLHEQLIRDRIVVGVRDKALSERMQLDSELTLEKAVKMVRQQQVDLQRPSTSQKVNQVSAVEDSSNLDDEDECRRRWTAEIQVNGKKVKFKLDSQADVTCVPLCLFKKIMGQQRLVKSDINIRAAEFSELQTVGMFISTLRNGNYEIKEKIYVIRRLSEPLLSRRACELLNLARRIEVVATSINPIKEFPEVFEGLGQIGNPYEIKLKPGAKPYAVHTPRRVPIPLMEKLKTRLEELEKAVIIVQVNVATEWCAPTVIAGKPNGDIRLCVDLSRLNEHVQREVHPMPVVEHMLGQLGEARFFSKLDANSGFHQIPLSPDCQHLTTFSTPFGRYKYCRMPFGISLAPEYFQRVMSIILQGMDGVMCYLDDILIFASDSKTHDRILRLVLRKLKEAKVTLNKAKCVFGVPRINFLGHILDEDGIRPDPAKIEAVAKMPAPTDVHGVRRFLGMMNHLGRFVENLSEIVAPLNQLLVKGQDFVWDCSQERAFRKLKELLTTQPILAAYDVRKPTMVSSDASSYGLGAVLKQEGKNGIWRPVAYSSRTMTPTEKRYAQIEKEALAITWACERFQDFLLGKRFRIETDHKPLIPLFSTKELSSLTPRLQRFRMRMMRFGFEIVHIPGKELLDADALSRQPLLTTEGGENERQTSAHINAVLSCKTDKDEMLTKIFEAQQEDTTLKAVVNYLEQGWPDKKKMSQALLSYWHVKDELGVQNGLLMRSCRLVIPASMKLEILDKLHAGHFGITKTRLRARETVWWPGISEEIAETVRKCSVCIQEAVSKHEPLIPTNFPTRPWQKIAMDLFKFENKWYLVVIDYYSRFPEMIQLDRLTANVVVRSCKSIFARHGIPETVVSDNGTQFGAAREFANFARQYGFTHVTSSPRFPQSNGMAEAGVKIAKLILKKNQDPSLGLLEYRSTPLENGYSPAELLMGRKLRTTLPIAPENLNPRLVDSQTLKRKEGRRRKDMKSRYDRRCGATDMEELSEGDTVWITDMRTWGIVKQKASTPRSYMVDTPVGTLRRNRFHLRKGVTVQYPADPSTPTFSGEELVENEKTPVVDYPSNDSEDGQIRTRRASDDSVLVEEGSGRDGNWLVLGAGTGSSGAGVLSGRTGKFALGEGAAGLESVDGVCLMGADNSAAGVERAELLEGMGLDEGGLDNGPCLFSLMFSAPDFLERSLWDLAWGSEGRPPGWRPRCRGLHLSACRRVARWRGRPGCAFPSSSAGRRCPCPALLPNPGSTAPGRSLGRIPETFDFSTPNEWPKWRKRFERYLVVTGMKKKEEADKIDLFMYLMGDRADDIFRTFKFEKEEEATKIDSVLKAFDSHFCVRKNIIYERAKFNSRIQEDREPVDEFITSLYKLADSCEFEGLHEQLIRDRIVVGVRDKALSERMQLDSELTLEKAVKMVRQQEAVRQQQVDLQRPSTSQKVNQVSAVEDSSNLDDEDECRRRWTAEIQVNGKKVKFKLDSQADVTCVPLCLFKKIMGQQRLVKSDINIRAAEFSELQTVGMFISTLRNGNYEIKEKIYVIRRLSEPLLSRRACELLNLARRIEVVATRINPIKEFPEVFEGLGQIGNPYEIKLKPGAKPYAVHTPRRVPIPLMEKLKTRLEELEKAGIIAQVNVATEWCAPTVIAGKPNGDIRLCVDLSRLNEHVQREVHPMPVVEHMLGQLGEARFFSKLDANSGFHQIPLSPDCQHLTTFITPFGRYKYCRMPFRISLAPEYFQRVMSIILQGMDGVMCYLDDILIFASDSKTHDRSLRLVLRKLKEAKVTLNKAKCVFGVPIINFLGHILDEDGIRPDPAKIEAVAKMPAPSMFMAQERAFRRLKELLTTQPILAAYDVRKPTMVSSDASSYGLGAVLKQEGKNGIWRPVAYSSRTMTPTEKRYAQIEKEALAITWACERFQDFLLGKRFRIETDHKPLIPLFSTKELSSLTPRLQRFRKRMMRFGFEIVHIPGKELLDADALSRQPLLTTEGGEDERPTSAHINAVLSSITDKDEMLTKIFEAQQEDTTLKAVVNYLEQGWPDKKKMSQALLSYWHVKDELGVQNGLLMRSCRLVIPASMKLEILDKLHAGHFGITKTRLRARETVWWPGISEEIVETVRKCSVLVQLDRLTANVVVRSCKSIFARHGIPETVVSDNGTQFGAAREFENFARQYGFTHVTSSPRFPQSNGMAEAGLKIAKLILKKNQDPSLGLLEYRSTPLENGYSPAELLMGRKLRKTLPIAPENLNPKLVDSQTLKRKEGRRRNDMKSRYDRRCGATDMEELSEGDTVWITDMRTWGIVKQKASTPRSYMVDTPVGTLRRNRFHLRKGDTVQYPADPSTPTFSGEELVENEKTPVVDYPSNDSEDGQIRTRSGRIVKPFTGVTFESPCPGYFHMASWWSRGAPPRPCRKEKPPKKTTAIFFDMTSAFDRVWREKLLEKLHNIGVRGETLTWIADFLRGRRLKVWVNGEFSKEGRTCAGVPQGSVLSPLLYLLYINDIHPYLTEDSKVACYADDIAIWHTSSSIEKTQKILNTSMSGLEKWAMEIQMTINPIKPNLCVFSTDREK
ncbi:K02A2.6-like, partial [Cordylochernes scorpioides]